MRLNLWILAGTLLIAGSLATSASAQCSSCDHRSPSIIRPTNQELWTDYRPPVGSGPAWDTCGPDPCGNCGFCRQCCPSLLSVVPRALRTVARTFSCIAPCGPRSGHGCGISCIGAGSGCTPGYCRNSRATFLFSGTGCQACSSGAATWAPAYDDYNMPSPSEPAVGPRPTPANDPFKDDPVPSPSPKVGPKSSASHSSLRLQKVRSQDQTAPRSAATLSKAPTKKVASASRTAANRTVANRSATEAVSKAQHLAPIVTMKQKSVMKRVSVETPVEAAAPPERKSPASKLAADDAESDEIPVNPLRR